MTITPRSPRLLVLSTVLLAVAGMALLCVPHGQQSPTPVAAPPTAAVTARPPVSVPSTDRTPTDDTAASTAPEAPTPSAIESALPPHGEGAAGDRAVQRNLETAWPPDLPAADERQLLAVGRALLRADATGAGRARWAAAVFPDTGQAVAPAFATAGFRIQAAIARRDGSPTKAVVHLVWAGTDRGGTFTDLRITDWHFTRTIKKGTATWTPLPRT
ncbi:hypothetical protein MBT84_47860 [Streptomyces sp. MBT84]|uniref:hypothetical protein n=1 Tax=Streptomyces sp. MBT84 TaxID=1488414 RepID=UPI001C6F12BE|nr:hypothetical protein [Streptomyces sp. MBT84]MBW8707377.1 hypothetical protein [Streptomyces sp. MBT84]